MSCPNCGGELTGPEGFVSHAEGCLLAVLLAVLVDRDHDLSGVDLDRVDADALWQRFGGPAADWLAGELGLEPDPPHGPL